MNGNQNQNQNAQALNAHQAELLELRKDEIETQINNEFDFFYKSIRIIKASKEDLKDIKKIVKQNKQDILMIGNAYAKSKIIKADDVFTDEEIKNCYISNIKTLEDNKKRQEEIERAIRNHKKIIKNFTKFYNKISKVYNPNIPEYTSEQIAEKDKQKFLIDILNSYTNYFNRYIYYNHEKAFQKNGMILEIINEYTGYEFLIL